ncbi:MAG: ABC transporter permease, partial [Treponemataceae bacterium]|nr:ABC transporter permease [Treponemataceae bacterium]
MTARASLLFAFRLIFPRTGRSSSARRSIVGAIICIGISVVPLAAVLSVSDGMIGGMTERIIGLSSSHLKVYLHRSSECASSAAALSEYAARFLAVDGVTAAYPQVELSALAAGRELRTGAEVRAVPAGIFQEYRAFSALFQTAAGDTADFRAGSRNAVVGEKIAELLGVSAGDSIRLITARRGADGTLSPRLTSFRVCAVVSSGYQELDALWVFVPLDAAFAFLSPENSSFQVLVETADAFSPELVRIQNGCRAVSAGVASVYRWDEVNAPQFQNFSSTRLMLVFVMALIVLVASVNISSALIMLVMERRRELAILKSLGGSSGGVAFSFLTAGVLCGMFGTMLGLPFGLLCAVNINEIVSLAERLVNASVRFLHAAAGGCAAEQPAVHLMDPAYYLSEIPVKSDFAPRFCIACAVLALSLLVSVVPAVKAGRE